MRNKRVLILLIIGLFFIFDRFLKWKALHGWADDKLIHKWFGWYSFLNPGVAFGIPVPTWLIILFTVPVLGLILFLIFKEKRIKNKEQANDSVSDQQPLFTLCSLLFIFFGALSNFIDRLIYGHTVDYLLIFTGVINLADVMILVGFLAYLVSTRFEK